MIINSMYKKPIKSTFPSDHSNKLSLNQVYHLRSMTSSRKQQLNAFLTDLLRSLVSEIPPRLADAHERLQQPFIFSWTTNKVIKIFKNIRT